MPHSQSTTIWKRHGPKISLKKCLEQTSRNNFQLVLLFRSRFQILYAAGCKANTPGYFYLAYTYNTTPGKTKARIHKFIMCHSSCNETCFGTNSTECMAWPVPPQPSSTSPALIIVVIILVLILFAGIALAIRHFRKQSALNLQETKELTKKP